MFDLKCKRVGCEYNEGCNCTAKEVEFASNTDCKTYKPSKEKEKNIGHIEEVEKIGQPPMRKNISVGCEAECIFNSNCTCTANGITVQTCDNPECPICCTFKPE